MPYTAPVSDWLKNSGHLKVTKMANFMLCLFYNNKRNAILFLKVGCGFTPFFLVPWVRRKVGLNGCNF